MLSSEHSRCGSWAFRVLPFGYESVGACGSRSSIFTDESHARRGGACLLRRRPEVKTASRRLAWAGEGFHSLTKARPSSSIESNGNPTRRHDQPRRHHDAWIYSRFVPISIRTARSLFPFSYGSHGGPRLKLGNGGLQTILGDCGRGGGGVHALDPCVCQCSLPSVMKDVKMPLWRPRPVKPKPLEEPQGAGFNPEALERGAKALAKSTALLM
ncbi:hypothetical protein NL676_032267 [Syzygium grande]|nr:hypothetical protein NL676_032267 [Syzygium grande]